jgi:hypothetical protein
MKFYVNNSMLLAVAIGLVSSSLAMANHRGYRSNGWNSSRNSSSHDVASTCSCGSTVEKSAPAPAVASESPTKERAFSYEPANDANSSNGSDAVVAPRSTRQATQYRGGSNNSSGNSYDRAMRAKGYYSR